MKITKLISLLLALLMITSLAACTQPAAETPPEEPPAEETPPAVEEGIKSGTYEVEGVGFGGKMSVKVTIKDGKIDDIEIGKNYETNGAGRVALEYVSQRIIEGQTTNVEAVSGATISSSSLMALVRKALEEAGATKDQFSEEYKIARDIKTEREAEIVIIGAGGTGLAAAVTAGQEGASVIVLETNGFAGGNLLVSGGVYNSPEPEMQAKQGIEDSPELFMQQTLAGGDNIANPELVRILAYNALDGLNWLKELGNEFEDQVIQAPGALHPRSHNTTAPLGSGIIKTYLEHIDKMDNVEILYETKGESLIQEDGRVVGVIAKNPDGSKLTVKANKGVIIATGGFSKNAQLVMEYRNAEKWPLLDENSVSTNMDSIRGEGIIMAREIGADVVDMDQMQFLYLGQPKTGLLSGVFNVSAEVTVFVNKEGKRFVAEDARRDVISSAVFAQEDGMMYMLHSAESLSDPANQLNIDGIPMKELLDIGAYGWKQGDTLEELAKEIGVPAENLVQTIAEYNEAVDTKNDPFGRTLLNVKMEKGPFYAIPRVPALHHTMGGLRIDTLARVLDTKGEPIPGLYAGGEVTGGIHGGNRLGGNAVTDTVVFGRLAAQSAVAGK
ncbi:MAG TPA: flavocytochrome c [Sedimentibacter sp.]|nr:flavocytochrome c [Sedimentibacter sp.]HPV85691.1 flavocytochrome c [Sedimentibacter sp.]HQC69660.1 flavocytochrome c [Sedimentibacter sp.]